MHIKIYQSAPRAEIGRVMMHEAEIKVSDINDICEIFGHSCSDSRRGVFRGYPLQTGDLVEVLSETGSVVYNFVDDEFTDGTLEVIKPTMDLAECIDGRNGIFCVLIEANKPARIVHFSLDDKTLNYFFHGKYQIVDLPTGVSMICSEDAFECHLGQATLNRILKNHPGEPFAVVKGPAIFCMVTASPAGNIVSSLSPEECLRLYNKYKLPERFYTINGNLTSLKYYPNLVNNVGGEGSVE